MKQIIFFDYFSDFMNNKTKDIDCNKLDDLGGYHGQFLPEMYRYWIDH